MHLRPVAHVRTVPAAAEDDADVEAAFFNPVFSRLSDVVQLVYLDHRGYGRSHGGGFHERWDLDG